MLCARFQRRAKSQVKINYRAQSSAPFFERNTMRQYYPAKGASVDTIVMAGSVRFDEDAKAEKLTGVGFEVDADPLATGLYKLTLDAPYPRYLAATFTLEADKPSNATPQVKSFGDREVAFYLRAGGKATKPTKGAIVHFVLVFSSSTVRNA